MYNPFPLFSQVILRDRISAGRQYFVRQTYPRGHEGRLKAAFLLCGYREYHLAKEHMERLAGKDGNSFLYDVEDMTHLEKLHVAAGQPFGYKIYYAGKIAEDWKPPVDYQKKIRMYIKSKHPDWQPSSGGARIEAGLFQEFGELFIKLSFKSEEDITLLEEIEKL